MRPFWDHMMGPFWDDFEFEVTGTTTMVTQYRKNSLFCYYYYYFAKITFFSPLFQQPGILQFGIFRSPRPVYSSQGRNPKKKSQKKTNFPAFSGIWFPRFFFYVNPLGASPAPQHPNGPCSPFLTSYDGVIARSRGQCKV